MSSKIGQARPEASKCEVDTFAPQVCIALHLEKTSQIEVGTGVIKRILLAGGDAEKEGRRRVLRRAKGRDPFERFNIITFLSGLFMRMQENPIISVDTKKKEVLRSLTRNEGVLTKGEKAVAVLEQDYPQFRKGQSACGTLFWM
jgi:hypothetical protein